MQDNEQNTVTETAAPISTPTTPESSNNKLLIGLAAAVVLMLVLIGLLAYMLLSKSTPTETSTRSQQENASTANGETKKGREVLLRAPTSDSKLEYIIYKPEQNGANTTIHFAIENTCSGCSDGTFTAYVTSSFSNKSSSFLVDDSNGKKYSLITDEDGEELASPSCTRMLKFGEKIDCFVSFTKVPSGSTVSWVFGSTRIDKINVE